jgi:dienelactone hydrolase
MFRPSIRRTLVLATVLMLFFRAMEAQGVIPAAGNVRTVKYETFGSESNRQVLILLHGVSGPSLFYTQQAEFFADHGFRVLLPHYLDATHDSSPTDEHYEAWVSAVRKIVDDSNTDAKGRWVSTVIVGYSLGASVALALGSQGQGPDAIAEMYGSLPDLFFRDLRGMPPLLILHGGRDTNIPVSNAIQLGKLCSVANLTCDTHIYPGEGHGFSPEALRDADQRILQFFAKVDNAERSPPAVSDSPR